LLNFARYAYNEVNEKNSGRFGFFFSVYQKRAMAEHRTAKNAEGKLYYPEKYLYHHGNHVMERRRGTALPHIRARQPAAVAGYPTVQ